MDRKKQIGKNLAALLLLLALMIPSAIQIFHSIEGHEHITCSEKTTHIHKSDTTCEICSFQFTSFSYDLVKKQDLLIPVIQFEVNDNLRSLQLHSFNITNTQLRAPPTFS